MPSTPTIGLLALALLSGCAHAPQPAGSEAPPPSVAAPPAQVKATLSPGAPAEATDELDSALRSAVVFFEFNRDQLQPQGQEALRRVADVLRRHPGAVLKVEGNCDERGTEEYNLMLGHQRALAARKYLIALGVGPHQLLTISYGAQRPANPGHDEDAWSQNRRDELHAAK